jgi:hypothetical protein
MTWQKSHLSLALFLVGELVLTAALPTSLWAQTVAATPSTTILRRSVVKVTFDPPGDGTPSDTAGGASRDGGICPEDLQTISPRITPLKPTNHSGLTVAEHPTFFVYVPQTAAQKAVFVLKDETEDYFYQQTISIPRTAGVVSFKLPDDAPALESGKTYQWSFVMICGQAIRPDSPAAEGKIQRIEPNPELLRQLKNLSPLERAALYGKNGLWYDTLASLAEQMRSQPNDSTLLSTWEKLLQSVGLEAIATKPLLQ